MTPDPKCIPCRGGPCSHGEQSEDAESLELFSLRAEVAALKRVNGNLERRLIRIKDVIAAEAKTQLRMAAERDAARAEVASLRVALERSKRDTGYEIGLAFARGHETGSSTEREACALLCEAAEARGTKYPAQDLATAIRARSTKGEK